jgi:hypothetical protein
VAAVGVLAVSGCGDDEPTLTSVGPGGKDGCRFGAARGVQVGKVLLTVDCGERESMMRSMSVTVSGASGATEVLSDGRRITSSENPDSFIRCGAPANGTFECRGRLLGGSSVHIPLFLHGTNPCAARFKARLRFIDGPGLRSGLGTVPLGAAGCDFD